MLDTFTLIFLAIISLLSIAAGLFMLIKLFREKGAGHAALGFFIPPYTFIWGWLNAKRLNLVDVMAFWTTTTIIGIALFVFIAVQEAMLIREAITSGTEFETTTTFDGNPNLALGSEDAIPMGELTVGNQVSGSVDDLFAVHNWTFNGRNGQVVTIRAIAANGHSTDPRINLIGPDGTPLVGNDDGGNDMNALISNYTLPATGVYTIQLDVWQTGDYEIHLD